MVLRNMDFYLKRLPADMTFLRAVAGYLIKLLKDKNIDSPDIRIIGNLYYNQKAVVKVDNSIIDEINIKRGVTQGCTLSPAIFNIYSEEIFSRAHQNETAEIKVTGLPICNLRYADGTILIAENAHNLQRILNGVVEESEEFGVTLNCKKTNFMIITKKRQH